MLDPLLDKNLPGAFWMRRSYFGLVLDEVLDKCGASRPGVDPPAQLGVERGGPIQQQRRRRRVLEMARKQERFVDRRKIVCIPVEASTDAIDIAKRAKKLKRSGKQASSLEKVDQPMYARMEESIAYRQRND